MTSFAIILKKERKVEVLNSKLWSDHLCTKTIGATFHSIKHILESLKPKMLHYWSKKTWNSIYFYLHGFGKKAQRVFLNTDGITRKFLFCNEFIFGKLFVHCSQKLDANWILKKLSNRQSMQKIAYLDVFWTHSKYEVSSAISRSLFSYNFWNEMFLSGNSSPWFFNLCCPCQSWVILHLQNFYIWTVVLEICYENNKISYLQISQIKIISTDIKPCCFSLIVSSVLEI